MFREKDMKISVTVCSSGHGLDLGMGHHLSDVKTEATTSSLGKIPRLVTLLVS